MTLNKSYIVLFSVLSTALPLVVALLRIRGLSLGQKWLTVLVGYSLINEGAARLAAHYFGTNLPLLHLYVAVEFGLLAWIFHLNLRENLGRKSIPILMAGFGAFLLINLLFFQGLFEFASNARTAQSFLLSGLAMVWFFQVFKEQKLMALERSFYFWLSIAVLLYFLGNVLLWVFGTFVLQQTPAVFDEIWTIHALLNIFLHTLYAIALLCKNPK